MSTDKLHGLLLLLAIGVAGWLLWPDPQPMPDTTFNLTDGRTLHSGDLRGKSVLMNFWSVACPTCRRDIPTLTRLHDDGLGGKGLMVIGVASAQDPPPVILSALEQLQPGYPIALDVHGTVEAAFGGIDATPTNFLISPDGRIRYVERGPLDEQRIRATLLTFKE